MAISNIGANAGRINILSIDGQGFWLVRSGWRRGVFTGGRKDGEPRPRILAQSANRPPHTTRRRDNELSPSTEEIESRK